MEQHTYLRTHDLSSEHLLIDLGEGQRPSCGVWLLAARTAAPSLS